METEVVPKLVNPENFKIKEIKLKESLPLPKGPKKLNLNKILLILFIIFTIFFLYNCKYGESIENMPVPYSIAYNLK